MEGYEELRFDVKGFVDLDIYYQTELIGKVIYPDFHFRNSSLRIKLFDRANEKYLFLIKIMLLCVSTNRAINEIDGMDPFSFEVPW